MCAYATPPGGIVATFIDSFFAFTFLADSPARYWMLFQLRTFLPPFSPARTTLMPSLPSTNWRRSIGASDMNLRLLLQRGVHRVGQLENAIEFRDAEHLAHLWRQARQHQRLFACGALLR